MVMGKMVSIYLTDREADGLRRFCEDHSCTQYFALKTALRELLLQPLGRKEEKVNDDQSKTTEQANTNKTGETETKSVSKKSTRELLNAYLNKPH